MSLRVRLYVFATIVAAAIAVALLAWLVPIPDNRSIQTVVCFSAIALLTELMGYTLARQARGTISFVPFLASAAIAPTWMTVCGVVLVTASMQLLLRRGAEKIIFNIGQQSLSVSIAILMYLACGGTSLLLIKHQQYLPLLMLFATYFVIQNICVSGVIAISEKRSVSEILATTALNALPYDLLAWPITLFLAWMYTRYGSPGAFAFAVPLLGLRQLYKTNSQLEQTNQELLELMVAAIEARDPYTSGHSRRVSQNAKIIAQILGLRQSEVRRIEIAALLHDVGKIHEIFASILQKPGRLTDEENAIMQTHSIKSEELVAKVSQLRDVVAPIRHHHENWDGTGYPDGLAGELIPKASRIIMFADTIDAMTSDRPYRKALDADTVRSELIKHRARQFDPHICDILLSSPRYKELFAHGPHQSLPHTQEVPRLRLAIQA